MIFSKKQKKILKSKKRYSIFMPIRLWGKKYYYENKIK